MLNRYLTDPILLLQHELGALPPLLLSLSGHTHRLDSLHFEHEHRSDDLSLPRHLESRHQPYLTALPTFRVHRRMHYLLLGHRSHPPGCSMPEPLCSAHHLALLPPLLSLSSLLSRLAIHGGIYRPTHQDQRHRSEL